jgi:hypothetical protein
LLTRTLSVDKRLFDEPFDLRIEIVEAELFGEQDEVVVNLLFHRHLHTEGLELLLSLARRLAEWLVGDDVLSGPDEVIAIGRYRVDVK